MMAKRAHVYPQVEPGAAALASGSIARAERGASVGAALRLARKRDAGALTIGRAFVLREDLARAEALGLEDLRASMLSRPLPTVAADRSEIEVRRRFDAGAPAVVVTEHGRPVAVAGAGTTSVARVSIAARLARHIPDDAQAALRRIGALAAERGMRAYLVGGVVRDLWRDVPFRAGDLDVVVEGDAPVLAEAVATALGGTLRVHERFLTASVVTRAVGRIDVITSRSERYERRGALPRVMPAGIQHDLRRRDFTINAMAVELGTPSADLLDPLGGRGDLDRRRLRILHPLSFVEDPTRIFRAARYAARLGFLLDAWSARCQSLALGLAPYPALSGQRIVAELEHIAVEPESMAALIRLGRAGAFRLLDPRYRFSRAVPARLGELPATLTWARDHGLTVDRVELLLLVLLDSQTVEIARASLRRLGFVGEPLERLERVLETSDATAAAIVGASAPSARVRAVAGLTGTAIAWLRLSGDGPRREVLDRALAEATTATPALRGDDVIALGVPRGPDVARALAALREARLDGQVGSRAAARSTGEASPRGGSRAAARSDRRVASRVERAAAPDATGEASLRRDALDERDAEARFVLDWHRRRTEEEG